MKVLVTGGTGALGRILSRAVVRERHAVRVMSQRPRSSDNPAEVEWARADLASGDGLRAAVAGVETLFAAPP